MYLWGFDLTKLYYWFMWLSTTFAILAVCTATGYFNQSSMLIASDEMMRWFFKSWWMLLPDMLQMVSIVLFLFGMCFCVLLTLPKAVGFALSTVIFILSIAILLMWLYMLKVNKIKAREIRNHSDSLERENQDNPNSEGALLFAEYMREASTSPVRDTCEDHAFKQLVVHRDKPMFLNCMLKDLNPIGQATKRLELINVIVRCKTPLELLIIK